MDHNAARFFADCDFCNLVADVISILVLDLDDRDAIHLAIDDDDTRLIRSKRDAGRAGRRRISRSCYQSGKNNCCRYQQPGRGIRAKLSGETSGFVNFS